MNASRWEIRAGLLLVFGFVVVLCLSSPLDVSASPTFQTVPPPANDMFAQASPLALPVSFTDSNAGATTEDNEPYSWCANYGANNTVWYAFHVDADMPLMVTVNSYASPSAWTVYSGTTFADLSVVACGNYWYSNSGFLAKAGQTYYIQYGNLYAWDSPGSFMLSVAEAPPPTVGIGWYRPNSYAMTTVQFYSYPYDPVGQGFTTYAWDFGNGATSNEADPQQLYVDAGSYVVSLTATTVDGRVASTTTMIDVLPLPPIEVWFGYDPSYGPSTFDNINFWLNTYDPAGHPIMAVKWDFGDGATSTEWYPSHKYTKEGQYTVRVQAATDDGRTGSSAAVVNVENHDAAVVKVGVPNTARTLQTKQVSVGVNSKYHDELVTVTLYKSIYGTYESFQRIAQSQQLVRAQALNKSTQFVFNYTFTTADAAVGKVTFKAEVAIDDKRDLLPADNTFISLPVKVTMGKTNGIGASAMEEDGTLLFLPAVSGD